MRDLVIGLFINRYECGVAIAHGINTFSAASGALPYMEPKADDEQQADGR